jgi:hypothetical protein
MNLAGYIDEIGSDLVRCNIHCRGIALNHSEGILPRCLIMETEGRAEGKGSVIVGINPGRSKEHEREFYRLNGQTYEQEIRYWQQYIAQHPYYRRLRNFAEELGFKGAILWTELVKCENASAESGLPPLQTFRTCTETYLQKELQAVPDDWALIAVGTEPYKALAYMFASRTVIGVPHPTGSRGQFARLFDRGKKLLPEVKVQTENILNGAGGEAVWLSLTQPRADSASAADHEAVNGIENSSVSDTVSELG